MPDEPVLYALPSRREMSKNPGDSGGQSTPTFKDSSLAFRRLFITVLYGQKYGIFGQMFGTGIVLDRIFEDFGRIFGGRSKWFLIQLWKFLGTFFWYFSGIFLGRIFLGRIV